MGKSIVLAVCLVGLTVFTGCVGMKTTPPEMLTSYQELKAGLKEDTLGASIEKLKAFQNTNKRYDISIVVLEEIATLQASVPIQYQKARDLVRRGEFEQAETILHDLATHFADMAESKLAQDFMRFEFPMLKASRFLMHGALAEARQTIQRMKKISSLSGDEIQQVERMLDGISNASAQGAQITCGALRTMLFEYYVENYQYPSTLSLQNLDFLGVSDTIQSQLLAIENYEASQGHFQFICVSTDGQTRLLVTEGGVTKSEAVR